MREQVEPSQNEHGDDIHPAWGMIGASRTQGTGTVLFDSDIKHQHTVRIRISTASRQRRLNHDYLHREQEFVEVEMSEAQWASFVSSMNIGSGVACTIRRRESDVVPGVPYEPRLGESMDEVRSAAEKAFEHVKEAFDAYAEKKNAANLRNLKYAIENAPSNVAFAGTSLNEHVENVVQRARADVEAMVIAKAQQLGIEPGDLGSPGELTMGEEEVS